MSYLFMYIDKKHKPLLGEGARYYGYEMAHTHYGIFDKATMWRAFKHDYEVLGHGEHPMQKFLRRNELEKLMVGHIVEIASKKQAVWLKLNYDRISKVDRCEFAGCYADLNPEDLVDVESDLQEVKEKIKIVQLHTNFARSAMVQASEIHKKMLTQPGLEFTAKQQRRFESFRNDMSRTYDEWDVEFAKLVDERVALEQKIIDYLKAHKVS